MTDLAASHTDQLAKDVRKYLRRRHAIAATAPLGVKAVWSVEEPRQTLALPGDADGIPGVRPRPEGERRREPRCYGSVAFVTGVFGLVAAAAVVQDLTGVHPRTPRVLHEAEQARRRKRAISTRKRRDG